MPAAPPPGFRHAHLRFTEADWHQLDAFARRSGLPISLAARLLVLRGLEGRAVDAGASKETGS